LPDLQTTRYLVPTY